MAQITSKTTKIPDDDGFGEETGGLTVSFFPGTTLRSKEVENVKLGTRVDPFYERYSILLASPLIIG